MNTLRTSFAASANTSATRPAGSPIAQGAALGLALVVTLSIFSGVTGLSAPSHAGAHLVQVHADTPVHS